MKKLSEPRRRVLHYAANYAQAGVVEYSGARGAPYNSWRRFMDRMCDDGLFKPYVHGGYEITQTGRDALNK